MQLPHCLANKMRKALAEIMVIRHRNLFEAHLHHPSSKDAYVNFLRSVLECPRVSNSTAGSSSLKLLP